MINRKYMIILAAALLLTGCGGQKKDAPASSPVVSSVVSESSVVEVEEPVSSSVVPETFSEVISVVEPEELPQSKGLICIDPGHQDHQNKGQEPVGPGSKKTKKKVSSGTAGRFTGLAEYKLNLTVGLLVRDYLEEMGYEVLMTRTTNDVDISNVERAKLANEAGADAFVRIHANGSEDKSVHGALTICQKKSNPYNGDIYKECRALSDCVLDALCKETGAKNRGVMESDTYSGINWCTVPVTIVEMGYMTNEKEDHQLAKESYQEKLARGIADGIDKFMESRKSEVTQADQGSELPEFKEDTDSSEASETAETSNPD